MAFGIEYPIAFLLLSIVLGTLTWVLKHKKRGALFHPWAEQLRARIGGGSIYSRFPFFARALAAACMVLLIAAPWMGYMETRLVEASRMIGLVIDASGSMQSLSGAPLEGARTVAQKIIEKRPEDRLGVIFFASEANYTAFGIPASYLTKEEVRRRGENLGGSTIATEGLFTAFMAIAREDEFLNEEEVLEVYNRVQNDFRSTEKPEQRREHLVRYIDSLREVKHIVNTDRLLVFISDCDLQYSGYDVISLMPLFEKFSIRIEVICLAEEGYLEKKAELSYREDGAFLKGVKATGGGVRYIKLATIRDPVALERELEKLIAEIDAMKPREVAYVAEPQKKFFARTLFFSALALLLLAEILAVMRWFRMNT